jgi:hypothetical protein
MSWGEEVLQEAAAGAAKQAPAHNCTQAKHEINVV